MRFAERFDNKGARREQTQEEGRKQTEEGRRKKEEGSKQTEEGRRKKAEGRRQKEEKSLKVEFYELYEP